jgi:hypothetical protein
MELGHTDTENTTCLNVPSLGLVAAGDAAYNDVHLYLALSDAQGRRVWIAAMLALYPHRVNPGWALWSSARSAKP